MRVGAAVPDKRVAAAALEAGIGGFSFLPRHPRWHRRRAAHEMPAPMGAENAANGSSRVRALDRKGEVHVLSNAEMGYAYRHSSAPAELIFVEALFEGYGRSQDAIKAAMDEVQHHRETVQADPREDRRLDLQEPAGQFGLERGRRGGRPAG